MRRHRLSVLRTILDVGAASTLSRPGVLGPPTEAGTMATREGQWEATAGRSTARWPRCHSRGGLSARGWRRDRGGSREDPLEEDRGGDVQRVTLGLLGFAQLEETARLAWALQVNREPDADRVVGRLQGLLARPPRLHPRRPRPSRGGAHGRSLPLTFPCCHGSRLRRRT